VPKTKKKIARRKGSALIVKLPRESDAQRIGHAAVQAFDGQRPSSWRPLPMDGDSDVGFDKFVQVVKKGRFSEFFLVQIKGTERVALDTDKTLAIKVAVATINYWFKSDRPVMLVLCDFSREKLPAHCPIYYLWATQEAIGAIAEGQVEKTVHVPKENRLDARLDVLPYLENLRLNREAQEQLFFAVAGDAGDETDAREKFLSAAIAVRRGGSFAIAAGSSEVLRSGSRSASKTAKSPLPRIDALIVTGQDREAEGELDRDQDLRRPKISRLEAKFQRARIAQMRGLNEKAQSLFEEAALGVPTNPRYVSAAYEGRFRELYSPDTPKEALRQLAASIPKLNHPRVLATRARIFAAADDFLEAKKLLRKVPATAAPVEHALLPYMQRQWSRVISHAKKMSESNISPTAKVAVTVLACRAQVNRDLGLADDGAKDAVVPSTGATSWKYKAAWSAWNAISEVFSRGGELGWPTCLELLLDIYSMLASALKREIETQLVLSAFAKARPAIHAARYHAIRLSILVRMSDEALELIRAATDRDKYFREEIVALYTTNEKVELVEIADKRLLNASDVDHPLHVAALLVAFVCARELARVEQAKKFETSLASRSEWVGELAVARFLATVNTEPLRREEAKLALEEAFKRNPTSGSIQDHLFSAIEPTSDDASNALLRVARAIEMRRRLSSDEIGSSIQAYWQLKRPDLVLKLLDTYEAQYVNDPKLAAYRAISLDQLGRSAEGMALLEKASSSKQWIGPPTAYVNIAIRSGLYHKAILAIERGLARATKTRDKRRLVQQMFAVAAADDPLNQQLQELAWRYGQLVDKTDEKQEGTFLQMFLMATTNAEAANGVPHDRVKEFEARAAAFFKSFPNSDVIRQIPLPEGKVAETLKREIEALDKSTPESRRESTLLRNQLERGSVIAPYAWRPQFILKYVKDVAHLWEITKRTSTKSLALALSMTDGTPRKLHFANYRDRLPVVDLITLLIVFDLGLLDACIDMFPKIGIHKSTLIRLQNLGNPLLGATASAVGLRRALARRAANIVQVGGEEETKHQKESPPVAEELAFKITLSKDGTFMWTDDLAFHLSVKGEKDTLDRVCTADLVGWLDENRKISVAEATNAIAQLATWGIMGVPVHGRYLEAAISQAIGSANSLKDMIAGLDSSLPLRSIADGIWGWKGGYLDIANHVARVVSHLAKMATVSSNLVAAVWDLWLGKVRLRTDIKASGEQQLAVMLVRTAKVTGNDVPVVRKLWSAYIDLVAHQNGPRMSEALEIAARQLAGVAAAEFAHKNQADEASGSVYDILSEPLVPGTADYDAFRLSYESRRVELVKA
jgi:hypothetical protein